MCEMHYVDLLLSEGPGILCSLNSSLCNLCTIIGIFYHYLLLPFPAFQPVVVVAEVHVMRRGPSRKLTPISEPEVTSLHLQLIAWIEKMYICDTGLHFWTSA